MYWLPGWRVDPRGIERPSCQEEQAPTPITWDILDEVFELTISTTFSAAHALMIQGEREPVHGHDWHVEAVVRGKQLDGDGLLCDFHELETALEKIVAPFQTADLNALEAFAGMNASAENVARHIGEQFAKQLPEGVRLGQLSVTEAPGCRAAWIPESKESF